MSHNLRLNKILLTGGGTGGSVTPLLALVDKLGKKDFQYLWIGTRKGVEKEMLAKENIKFKAISSTKLRRYFSPLNLLIPFQLVIGFIQSFFIIIKFRPQWIISAGGFVSVPVVWVGWLLGRKILIHQQDAKAGLANKLMASFARVITVTFEKSLRDYGKKARWIGNPVRSQKSESQKVRKSFNLKSDLPIALILGGGTGSVFLNNLVVDSLKELTKICQIIHLTGKGKKLKIPISIENYYSYEFFSREQMAEAQTRADVVVSRCGMATLTELSYLGKPSILIYLPGHQEHNARIFEEYSAAIVLDQPVLEKTFFIKKVKKLLNDKKLQKQFTKNIQQVIKKQASEALAKIIKR